MGSPRTVFVTCVNEEALLMEARGRSEPAEEVELRRGCNGSSLKAGRSTHS
jgi:hypothetical protein